MGHYDVRASRSWHIWTTRVYELRLRSRFFHCLSQSKGHLGSAHEYWWGQSILPGMGFSSTCQKLMPSLGRRGATCGIFLGKGERTSCLCRWCKLVHSPYSLLSCMDWLLGRNNKCLTRHGRLLTCLPAESLGTLEMYNPVLKSTGCLDAMYLLLLGDLYQHGVLCP